MKKKQAGKRAKAGRKPIEDKKVVVTLYVRESKIKELTLDGVKQRCYEALT